MPPPPWTVCVCDVGGTRACRCAMNAMCGASPTTSVILPRRPARRVECVSFALPRHLWCRGTRSAERPSPCPPLPPAVTTVSRVPASLSPTQPHLGLNLMIPSSVHAHSIDPECFESYANQSHSSRGEGFLPYDCWTGLRGGLTRGGGLQRRARDRCVCGPGPRRVSEGGVDPCIELRPPLAYAEPASPSM